MNSTQAQDKANNEWNRKTAEEQKDWSRKVADADLLSACQAVNGLIPAGEGLRQKWADLNGPVLNAYKTAHDLPASYGLTDCVRHYNARH